MSQAEPRVLKHQVVRAHVDELLDRLDEGAQLPSERELALRFEVSRETVRQAMRELLVAGRIQRRGRGTVVARPKLVQPLALGSYTEAARAEGREARRDLVAWTRLTADDFLAEALAIAAGDPVVELERVLIVDGVPVGLETTRLPAYRYPGLVETFDTEASLYAEIRSRGIPFAEAVDSIETTLPDAREAALLSVDARTPMFLLNRISYDPDRVPIEHRRSLYRGDRMTFTSIQRRSGEF
ncbi:GntR family transcriptional regulator [Nocardia asteroides]|uniref:GntR family transcriptional regulator n=1 Tax=Nocardia asteroides TaxID=1824 RepID=UPI0022B81E9D|nr:GntR family transcriptional regulator [Nocardia asteroides]